MPGEFKHATAVPYHDQQARSGARFTGKRLQNVDRF